MGLVFRLRSRFRFCERKARKESCSCNQQPNNKPGYTVTFWLHNLVTLWPGYSDLVIVAFRLSNDLVGHWPSGYTVTQLQWLYGYIVTFLVIIQAHLLTEINLKKTCWFLRLSLCICDTVHSTVQSACKTDFLAHSATGELLLLSKLVRFGFTFQDEVVEKRASTLPQLSRLIIRSMVSGPTSWEKSGTLSGAHGMTGWWSLGSPKQIHCRPTLKHSQTHTLQTLASSELEGVMITTCPNIYDMHIYAN